MSTAKVKKPRSAWKNENNDSPMRLSILKVSGFGISQFRAKDSCQDQIEPKVLPKEL